VHRKVNIQNTNKRGTSDGKENKAIIIKNVIRLQELRESFIV